MGMQEDQEIPEHRIPAGLTDKERELLDALIAHKKLGVAAKALGISTALASKRKTMISLKYVRAKRYIKEVDYYRMQMPSVMGI